MATHSQVSTGSYFCNPILFPTYNSSSSSSDCGERLLELFFLKIIDLKSCNAKSPEMCLNLKP